MNIFSLTDDEFTDDDLHKSEYGELLKISKYLTNCFGYFWFVNDEKVEDKMVIENLENSIIILVNFQYSEVIIINTETTKEVSTLFPAGITPDQIARFLFRNITKAQQECQDSGPEPCFKVLLENS